jgi:hypothetical protein
MIARAGKKARKVGVEVVFQNALAETLPFPDGQFDAVLTTVMLHHLPRKPRQQCAQRDTAGSEAGRTGTVNQLPKLPLVSPNTLNWRHLTKTRFLVIGNDGKWNAH